MVARYRDRDRRGHRLGLRVQVRLPRPENYFFKSGRGLSHEIVDAISAHKDEPDWMRKFRLKSLEYFSRARCRRGAATSRGIDFENIFYYIKPTEKQADVLGRPARRHQGHLGQARHPRGREEVPGRRRRAVRVRGRLPQAPGGARRSRACSSSTWTRACASTRTSSSSTSGRSSRRTTTSSLRSTPPSGRAAPSSTCRRASRSRCRSRPTSASTPRTWASSSGR